MRLDHLYHWSPATNRELIRAEGLKPYSPSRDGDGLAPYICLSPRVSWGWVLSGGSSALDDESSETPWDVWEVEVRDGDDIRYRRDLTPEIQEVKVYTPLPADRLWLVGTRELESFR
jgi:hypothetical protein